MKKSKLVLCTMFIICLLTIATFADENPPLCRDGEVPINGRCKDGFPPRIAVETNTTDDQTTLEEFFEWVKSLF